MSSRISPNNIVIALPVYRERILDIEVFSIKHLFKYLGDYPIRIIAPAKLTIPFQLKALEVEWFDSKYFSSIEGYNQLLLSADFYERFVTFQYMLVYQLDALVFSNQLLAFCQMGWDYIGAPWFISSENPYLGFSHSGNGGFSLRKIDSFLRVLSSPLYYHSNHIMNFLKIFLASFGVYEKNFILRFLKRANIARKAKYGVHHYIKQFKWNEDRFWATQAKIFDPSFRVAPVDVGLKFSFERFPEYCFIVNQRQLPFGCHAWYRYDKSFWEPFLVYE